jgi:5-oxoprolinase (ATP-hydrolysing)/N-methylhydantoinase A
MTGWLLHDADAFSSWNTTLGGIRIRWPCMSQIYRLGIDVGGTFTDLMLVDDTTGQVTSEKLLTTPADPWLGIRDGILSLSKRGFDLGAISTIVHGTTLVINALIERRGAKVGLITTRGFRDILYFGRELRYDIYDPDLTLPEPLVPRHLRREVSERVDSEGNVVEPLDVNGVREAIQELLSEGVESFAVCLLHSYLRPGHELAVREIIAKEASGYCVSLSHQVLPQIREYERCSATTINAYVQPLVQTYLGRLTSGLNGIGCPAQLFLMTSSGGAMTPETAMEFPIQLVESGPVAGALIAGQIGTKSGMSDLLAFDMGGTTAKSCLIHNGKPLINRSYEVARVQRSARGSGLPVGIPVVDLLEIGAGGGSIAGVNGMGLLSVGPRSAGADPGPACYGRGGIEPTVTDANVVLGLINPRSFLGGSMTLDPQAARRSIEPIAARLNMEVEEAAIGIHRLVTENMAEAARVHSVEMNTDIRGRGMVAFGGAGPIHAVGIAERLGLALVVCPREAGVLSAWGLLVAPVAFEFVRSWPSDLQNLDVDRANEILASLRVQVEALIGRAGADDLRLEYSVDMCYSGQRYEVTTPLLGGALMPDGLNDLKSIFDQTYEHAYGRRLEGLAARCVTWRVLATGVSPAATKKSGTGSRQLPSEKGMSPTAVRRSVIFPDHGKFECAVYRGAALLRDTVVVGPAVIEEAATTIVVPPGWQASLDSFHAVVITREKSQLAARSRRIGDAQGRRADG